MQNTNISLTSLFRSTPAAGAIVRGNADYPDLRGTVRFYRTPGGTVVLAQFVGLPYSEESCSAGFFGFHIHEGDSCTGTASDAFADTGTHFDKGGCPHPFHTGDLPPLLNAKGAAFLAFLTDRFTADSIVGRTVIVHSGADDFHTQPSGNSGTKIACGEIVRIGR